jgi:hypothetical protein
MLGLNRGFFAVFKEIEESNYESSPADGMAVLRGSGIESDPPPWAGFCGRESPEVITLPTVNLYIKITHL